MIPYMKTIEFEIFVAEFIEDSSPKTIEEIEDIAESLHNSLEVGIKDYIDGEDRFDYDYYEPLF